MDNLPRFQILKGGLDNENDNDQRYEYMSMNVIVWNDVMKENINNVCTYVLKNLLSFRQPHEWPYS